MRVLTRSMLMTALVAAVGVGRRHADRASSAVLLANFLHPA
jgi:hypothetical protein